MIQTAWKASGKFGAKIVVIKESSNEYRMEKDPPPCPSVKINDRFVVQNGTVTYDELKLEILKDTNRSP